jgi:hypothetical protein
MATWEDVSRLVLALPETIEREGRDGVLDWRVRDKPLVWERPLRPKDREALGDNAPDGPILAARTPGLAAKEALLADDPATYFTTPHFNGYPAVLVRLDVIEPDELAELITEAWLAQVPKRMAARYLADGG